MPPPGESREAMTLRWISPVASSAITTGLAEVALDVELSGAAVAAVDRYCAEFGPHRGCPTRTASPGRLPVAAFRSVVPLHRAQQQLAVGGVRGGLAGQIAADRLVPPDGLAEAVPLARVAQRSVQGGSGGIQRAGGNLDAADLQSVSSSGRNRGRPDARQRVDGA